MEADCLKPGSRCVIDVSLDKEMKGVFCRSDPKLYNQAQADQSSRSIEGIEKTGHNGVSRSSEHREIGSESNES
jgi:hypothetical protein